MPEIPKPVASPDLMPWIRWAQGAITGLTDDALRKAQSDANTNASQNSTMTMLVEKLGTVQSIMDTIGSSLTIDAGQVVSGTFLDARIPALDAAKITTGTVTRPVSTSGSVTAGGFSTTGDVTANGYGTFNQAWNYNVSAVSRQAVWMDSSGKLGQTASTERFKKDIESWTPQEQAVLALQLVRFHWKPEYGDSDHWEYGLIAERLHELGLTWLVAYEEDGTPRAIHYDRLALALLPVIQGLAADRDATNARLVEIEARLTELEGNN